MFQSELKLVFLKVRFKNLSIISTFEMITRLVLKFVNDLTAHQHCYDRLLGHIFTLDLIIITGNKVSMVQMN
jgi:hypothetical protein